MKPQPHKDKKNYLQKLSSLVNDVIAASDDFENSRGKLTSRLTSGQTLNEQEVKDVLEKKTVASEKHQRLVTCVLNHKHCCSDKERADIAEALASGYKHLKELLMSGSQNT